MRFRAALVAGVATAFGIGAIYIGAPTSAAGQPAATANLCSLIPFPGIRDRRATYFVATALADTVLAGENGVHPDSNGGHWGPGSARAVYGQVVHVDTLGGVSEAALDQLLEERQSRDVVVVPWDYDPACRTTYWSSSARWTDSGLVGFYAVRLRDEKGWADGRPTFDAFAADLTPYPHGPFYRAGHMGTDALRSRPSLDAREYFSLYAALPVDMREGDSATLAPVRRWAAAHPALAGKYPADEILEMLELRPER
jgi:hypothetical protein